MYSSKKKKKKEKGSRDKLKIKKSY